MVVIQIPTVFCQVKLFVTSFTAADFLLPTDLIFGDSTTDDLTCDEASFVATFGERRLDKGLYLPGNKTRQVKNCFKDCTYLLGKIINI